MSRASHKQVASLLALQIHGKLYQKISPYVSCVNVHIFVQRKKSAKYKQCFYFTVIQNQKQHYCWKAILYLELNACCCTKAASATTTANISATANVM